MLNISLSVRPSVRTSNRYHVCGDEVGSRCRKLWWLSTLSRKLKFLFLIRENKKQVQWTVALLFAVVNFVTSLPGCWSYHWFPGYQFYHVSLLDIFYLKLWLWNFRIFFCVYPSHPTHTQQNTLRSKRQLSLQNLTVTWKQLLRDFTKPSVTAQIPRQ